MNTDCGKLGHAKPARREDFKIKQRKQWILVWVGFCRAWV